MEQDTQYHHEPCPVCGGKMIVEYGIGIKVISCEDHKADHPSYMAWGG